MSTYYLAASIEFWDAITAQRTSVCQRMKFTSKQKETAWVFCTKAEAIAEAQKLKLCVISETKYASDNWKYQLLISTEQ